MCRSSIIILLIVSLVAMAGKSECRAQNLIKLDAELKSHSIPMKIHGGTKFVGHPKYYFGDYKLLSTKFGPEVEHYKRPYFGNHAKIRSSRKGSFVLTFSGSDTCIAHMRELEEVETDEGNWFSREFLGWRGSEITKGEGLFETIFTFPSDTSIVWAMEVLYPVSIETADGTIQTSTKTTFRGLLTDGTASIQINQVVENEKGKKQIFNPVLGYEFWHGQQCAGALQVIPVNRMQVWIRDDLDNQVKFVIANAATALLIKTLNPLLEGM